MGQRFSKRLRCAKHSSRHGKDGEISEDRCIYYHRPVAHARTPQDYHSETGCKRQKLTTPPLGPRRELCGLAGSPGLGGLVMCQRPAHLSTQQWNCVCKASLGLCLAGAPAADRGPSGYPPGWCRFWTHSPRALRA